VDVETQNRRQSEQQKELISRNFAKPSDGLEPSTPSLPSGTIRLLDLVERGRVD